MTDEKVLWTQNGVESIRDIEKQRRQQAEAKKEELRQLVGRRYRVLLESADWIEQMRDLSKHTLLQLDLVSSDVAQLEKRKGRSVKNVKKMSSVRAEGGPDWIVALRLDCYDFSCVLRHIVCLPEKIWEVLRANEFMRATEMYFQALGLVEWTERVLVKNLTLEKQTATIQQFPVLIVRQCKKRLKTRNLPLQEQTQALCAIWLLSSLPLTDVVKLFFDCRSASITFVIQAASRALEGESGANEHSQSKADTVVAAVEDVARLLQSSVQHAAVFFGPGSLANRLKREGPSENLNSCLQRFRTDCLPSFLAIVERHSQAREGPTELVEIGGAWLKEILVAVSSGCGRLLEHLERGQHIGQARDALLTCLGSTEATVEGKPRQDAWRQACNAVLGRPVALWEEGFLVPFQARFRAIILLSFSRLSLDALLERASISTSSFSSSPLSSSLSTTAASSVLFDDPSTQERWTKAFKLVPVGNLRRRGKGEEESLRGLTGSRDGELHEICKQFNAQLALVVSDISHILQIPTSYSEQKVNDRSMKALLRVELRPFVHSTCTECMAKLTNNIRLRLTGLEAQILETGPQFSLSLVDQAVFVSRVCCYLLGCSKPLQELAALEMSETDGRTFAQQSLQNVGRAGLSIWTRFTAFILSDSLRGALGKWLEQWRLNPTQAVLWPVENVSSISVPVQPSACVSQFLFRLMDEVYRVHGHFVSQEVLACVITDLTASVLAVLNDFIQAHSAQFTEHAALQLVFDIKYLFSVLRLPKAKTVEGPSPREQLLELLQTVENVVDPIDYVVASSIINIRIAQLMTTSVVMFGIFVRANPFSEPFPSPTQPEQIKQEGFVLAVAPPIARVQTFPVKLYPSKKSKAAAVEALSAKEDLKLPLRSTPPASSPSGSSGLSGSSSAFGVPPTIGVLSEQTTRKAKEFFGRFGLSN